MVRHRVPAAPNRERSGHPAVFAELEQAEDRPGPSGETDVSAPGRAAGAGGGSALPVLLPGAFLCFFVAKLHAQQALFVMPAQSPGLAKAGPGNQFLFPDAACVRWFPACAGMTLCESKASCHWSVLSKSVSVAGRPVRCLWLIRR
jgi:hypothetical protein